MGEENIAVCKHLHWQRRAGGSPRRKSCGVAGGAAGRHCDGCLRETFLTFREASQQKAVSSLPQDVPYLSWGHRARSLSETMPRSFSYEAGGI